MNTSMTAYQSVNLTVLEELVLSTISSFGVAGCISDDVRKAHPHLSYSSVTARFSSLEKSECIFRSGETKAGESGRQQKVMRDIKYVSFVKVVSKPRRNAFKEGLAAAYKMITEAGSYEVAKIKLASELTRMAAV